MKKAVFGDLKMFFYAFALIIVIFLFSSFTLNASTLLEDPCWRKVGLSLGKVENPQSGVPEIVIDGECLKKMVFTTDNRTCEATCREHGNEDDTVDCIQKCRGVKEGHSMVIALPKEGSFEKASEERDPRWMGWGSPYVFIINCQITSITETIEECTAVGGDWICLPESDVYERIYKIAINKKTKESRACEIVDWATEDT